MVPRGVGVMFSKRCFPNQEMEGGVAPTVCLCTASCSSILCSGDRDGRSGQGVEAEDAVGSHEQHLGTALRRLYGGVGLRPDRARQITRRQNHVLL